ncbi:MAG: MSHA biogenesis protein MshG [Betaproteobacteria bacterium RIFCSPLOWO2_12_FULL_64_23]|nr:MAG: MSHA biogenesis protein MshG [Betaproteobacteria bacterium RIFCSPLOWO2_12_FULL_64_23]
MPYFAYKGRNAGGEQVQGVLEGGDSGAVATQLFNTGITPIEINPSRTAPSESVGNLLKRLVRPGIPDEEILLFSRQMHTLLKSGVPIMRALAGLQESSVDSRFKEVVKSIRENLDGGREMSAALQRQEGVFTDFYINMVRIGEMTGMLDQIFLRLFHHLEFEKSMREQVKAALRYPSFVVAAMAIAIVIINLFVIPVFAKVFKGFGAKLPWMTQLLIDFSDFTVAYWPLVLAAFIAAGVGYKLWVGTERGRYQWDEFKLRIPVAGKIIRKATLARFSRSFALASTSGVPVVQALTTVARTVDNDFMAAAIERMREGVERGESVLRVAVASGVFTPVVLQMLAVGEESGALDDLMVEIADMYQREVEYELKSLGAQIEPILIIGLGIMVTILALGVFLPMWDLGQAALKK